MNFAKIFGILVFSAIGYAYYKHAKVRPSYVTLVCSIFLLSFAYLIDRTWLIYLLGIVASMIPLVFHFWRNR